MVYSAVDEQLLDELNAVKEVIHKYNLLSPADAAGRLGILKDLLGSIGDDEVIINQPFYCDYGKQISVVTKDIPSNVVAVGNPCHVVKQFLSKKK